MKLLALKSVTDEVEWRPCAFYKKALALCILRRHRQEEHKTPFREISLAASYSSKNMTYANMLLAHVNTPKNHCGSVFTELTPYISTFHLTLTNVAVALEI